jgi:uncharacterized small protein (DUF1192 family)
MRKCTTIVAIGMTLLLSGCSLSRYYDGKTPIELEQYENPMIWQEVLKMQVALWPMEKKVNQIENNLNELKRRLDELEKTVNGLKKHVDEMKDELATTQLSSIQANQNIASLQAEIQQIKSDFSKKEKTAIELPIGERDKMEIPGMRKTSAAGEGKKDGPDIQPAILTDIQYSKVSDTLDRVLIYMSASNNPKFQTLGGENPRIILDFLNARNIEKEKYEISTDGNFIRRIRVRSYKEPLRKVRVVFDMIPGRKYSIDRKFSKEENLYSFDIKAK